MERFELVPTKLEPKSSRIPRTEIKNSGACTGL